MKKIFTALSLVSALSFASGDVLAAGDAAKGKAKAATCVACHGANGIAIIPQYPNLAGQKEQYLILQLKAYRDGTRKNPIMAPMATGLSDEDINDLSAYYASLPAGG